MYNPLDPYGRHAKLIALVEGLIKAVVNSLLKVSSKSYLRLSVTASWSGLVIAGFGLIVGIVLTVAGVDAIWSNNIAGIEGIIEDIGYWLPLYLICSLPGITLSVLSFIAFRHFLLYIANENKLHLLFLEKKFVPLFVFHSPKPPFQSSSIDNFPLPIKTKSMLARVYSCVVIGLEGAIGIEVELDTGQELPGMKILGSKDRIVTCQFTELESLY